MVFEKVQELLASQLNLDKAKISTNSLVIEDLGADSLDMVEMLMTLEEEFGISIPDEDATGLKTVGNIVEYIENHKK